MKNIKRNVLIVLVCVGVICFIVCVTNMSNEKENTFNASKESGDVVCNESSQEEQSRPEEQENYDSWEIEHVREIEFGPMEYVTQDDIVHIGRFIHLKRLSINIDESEIDLSPLGSLVEPETEVSW